ncbi:MAG TPA: hypothetical protein VGC59_01405 [Solirubrobacteraceae bacterium]
MSVTALGGGAMFAAAPAQAGLLGGVLPNLGTIITGTGQALGSLIPGVGGVITGVTGTVGGVVSGVQATVTGVVDQTLDQTLGGSLGGLTGGLTGGSAVLPTNVLNPLIGTLLNNSVAKPGVAGTGAPIVLTGGKLGPGGVVVDASAPRPVVRVLSRLKGIGRDGKMRLEVRTDEPGIVAVAGNVRPGAPVSKAVKTSRKLIKVPNVVLAYRKAGRLVVTVKFSRAAQRALGASKNARMSVGTVASDIFRNQDAESVSLSIGR